MASAPSKGACIPGGFKWLLLHRQLILIQVLLMRLLLSDILAHRCFIQARSTHTVAACPKVVPGKIFSFAKVATVYEDCGLPFQPPYRLRYRISWGDAQTHVDMVRLGVPLDQANTKLVA